MHALLISHLKIIFESLSQGNKTIQKTKTTFV